MQNNFSLFSTLLENLEPDHQDRSAQINFICIEFVFNFFTLNKKTQHDATADELCCQIGSFLTKLCKF